MKFPESVLLPRLKFLQLYSVKFTDKYPINRLLSGCPMLEELVLQGGWEDVQVINIYSTTVTSLTMDFTDGFMSYQRRRTDVVLEFPNLVHFKYMDYLAKHYCMKNFNSLEDARIELVLELQYSI